MSSLACSFPWFLLLHIHTKVEALVPKSPRVSSRVPESPLRYKPCKKFFVVEFKVGMIVSVKYTEKKSVFYWAKVIEVTSQGFKVRWIDDDPQNLNHPPHHLKAIPGSAESSFSTELQQQKATVHWDLRRANNKWFYCIHTYCSWSIYTYMNFWTWIGRKYKNIIVNVNIYIYSR